MALHRFTNYHLDSAHHQHHAAGEEHSAYFAANEKANLLLRVHNQARPGHGGRGAPMQPETY